MLAGVLKKRLGFPENLEGLTNAWWNCDAAEVCCPVAHPFVGSNYTPRTFPGLCVLGFVCF